jgi:hypothetical protein
VVAFKVLAEEDCVLFDGAEKLLVAAETAQFIGSGHYDAELIDMLLKLIYCPHIARCLGYFYKVPRLQERRLLFCGGAVCIISSIDIPHSYNFYI